MKRKKLKPLLFITTVGLFFVLTAVRAGESYYTLPFEKLLNLAACAEMKTLGQDCATHPQQLDERSMALESGLEDLWALTFGEKTPKKVQEASRIIRSLVRFDLGILIKNPLFARAVLLRAETGIKFLMEKNWLGPLMELKMREYRKMQVQKIVQRAENLFTNGKFDEMRLQLFQALWLADPVTTGEPMMDPDHGQGLASLDGTKGQG